MCALSWSLFVLLVLVLSFEAHSSSDSFSDGVNIDLEDGMQTISEIFASDKSHRANIHSRTRTVAEKLDNSLEAAVKRMKQLSNELPRRLSERSEPARAETQAKEAQRKQDSIEKEKEREKEVETTSSRSALHEKTNQGRPAFPGREGDHSSTGRGETRSMLESYGVSDRVLQEINRLAVAKVPRESIMNHIRDHFPGKTRDELNDIVVGALGAASRAPPKSSLDKAKRNELLFQKLKFERNAASFDAQK